MSKKIALSVPVQVIVRDRDARLLAVIARLSERDGGSAAVSHAELAAELGLSLDTMRRAVISCRDEGYLRVTENYLPNGGRMANSYVLTDRGAALAEAAREALLVA